MFGLMISTIEAIIWLAVAFLALLVRTGFGILNLVLTGIRYACGRRRQPRVRSGS